MCLTKISPIEKIAPGQRPRGPDGRFLKALSSPIPFNLVIPQGASDDSFLDDDISLDFLTSSSGRSSPLTATPPSPTPSYTSPGDLDDVNMSDGRYGPQPFTGDDDAVNPQDFINSVERGFLLRGAAVDDKTKVRSFELWLSSEGSAKEWWDGLEEGSKATWDALRAVFDEQWPPKPVTAKTAEENHAKLLKLVLQEESLGKRVGVDGSGEFSHVVWANKLERLASSLKDTSGLLIPVAFKSMPRALRQLVGVKHTSWKEFCAAVRAVSIAELEEALEVTSDFKMVYDAVMRQQRGRPNMQSLQDVLAAASISNQQQQVPSATPPRFTPQACVPPMPRGASQPATSSTFQQRLFRPDAERLADVQRVALPHHPNTPAGVAAYKAQIAQWNSSNAGLSPNELRPYPLSPGTAPVMSGECWKCGMVGHRSSECSATAKVPLLEEKWRSIAASIKRRAGEASVVGGDVAVNWVDAAGNWTQVDRADYDDFVISRYLEEQQNQGNGEGSSA
ncbi:hypothetical protein CPC08DRAFT_770162 [Agrocybe pediades]|nr:hypothetical protein CPC08DRAFT_770162 [Agrocybe pediades]